MRKPKLWEGALGVLLALASVNAHAIVIGYFDSSREQYGFSGGDPYLSQARQFLVDEGHTLVATNLADAAFLSTVDAFYTGLISSISAVEIASMQSFVDVDGGFLFIQQDHDMGLWHAPAQQILANWGITSSAGTFGNDFGHTTTGSSEWVTDPNIVSGFAGAAHSAVGNVPVGFETLATDDAGRVILGVFDAGAGRSSDVLVATDIDFWSDGYGWLDTRNQALWENIWTAAADQIDPPVEVPEPGTLALLGIGLLGLAGARRRSIRG
jgi:hypothetical protein